MRYSLGQVPEATLVRPASGTTTPAAVAAAKEIPYDYVARFILEGRPSNRVQDVINISVEGAFVAVAIGYSFIPAELTATATIPLTPPSTIALAQPSHTTLPEIIAETIADQLQLTISGQQADRPQTVSQLGGVLQCLLIRLCGIDFKYSIVDSATGRELQNQPIHNTAGLGEPTGDRPFRPFAKPMLFLPRSTIRIEIEELSAGPLYAAAELYIVLHGYKILGYGTAVP